MRFFRVVAAVALAAALSGCAEWRNRGGIMDAMQDKFIFKADSKHMRLLRSYVMVAGLTRVAAKSPLSQDERIELAIRIRTATMTIQTAYLCAGPVSEAVIPVRTRDHAGCAFFDEKMADLDSTLLRMARSVFMPEENRDLLETVRRGLSAEAPIVGGLLDVVESSTAILDKGSKLVTSAGVVINAPAALFRLAANAFRSGSRLAPIYRDALELEMQVALDSIPREDRSTACPGKFAAPTDRKPPLESELFWKPGASTCDILVRLVRVYANGSGELGEWAEPLKEFFEQEDVRFEVRPEPAHFQDVSELQMRMCEQLVGPANVASCFPSRGGFHNDLIAPKLKERLAPGN